jgi:diguanylate cyclase (GGDEF)-like protein/PAS domain S-box-containing protein
VPQTASAATILVVDDEPKNRKLLELYLRPEGYTVQTAAGGAEALASIGRAPPDLILLDYMMPGMDGFQVTSTLKADSTTSNIPIIVVTASVGFEARLACLKAGAEDFLMKPVDRDELCLRVRNLLRIKTYGDLLKNYGDVLEQEVQQRAGELLRFRTAMDKTADAIVIVSRTSMRFVEINATACSMFGYTREEFLEMGPGRLTGVAPDGIARMYDTIVAGRASNKPVEQRLRRKDGTVVEVEVRRHAHQIGEDTFMVGVVRDISERKAAELKIKGLLRMHTVLSGINSLIARGSGRDELFKGACRIAVEDGGFQTAWIGVVDQAGTRVVPAAYAGAVADFFDRVGERLVLRDDALDGQGAPAVAIRNREPVVVNSADADPLARHEHAPVDHGVGSLVVLPLLVAGKSVGVLGLHASETGFFVAEEMKLLHGLAGDIAFAIDHIDKQERLAYLATYDALTGFANRALFVERLAQHMRRAASGGHKLAVYMVDLERFKSINDTLGQAAGDALLVQVAKWLTLHVVDVTLLARVGADQFAVVLPNLVTEGGALHLLERTVAQFMAHPFLLNNATFRVAAKVGAALFPDDGSSADTLFRNAEAALKKAKVGGDRYLFYTAKMTASVAGDLTLENQLRKALDNSEFVLHYQPKVSVDDDKLVGVEALIRWNDPASGLVPPGRFIPILEATGLIHDVGRWAMRDAIGQYLRWVDAGLPAIRIAVNVSPLQLRDRDFIEEVRQAVSVDPRAAAGLELEITESLIMEDVEHSIASLGAIRALGVTVAIDDFGTGFSSLSYLAKLPADTLKIDRSFVGAMSAGSQGLALVATIINLAHAMKLVVVAEGVETREQSKLLKLLGCDEMQGFLIAKPLASEKFAAKFLAPPSSGQVIEPQYVPDSAIAG